MTALDTTAAMRARRADAGALAAALADTRRHTLATFAAYRQHLGNDCAVPYSGELNPPRWEVGHIQWFQDWWLARNPQRTRGAAADPLVPRPAPRRAGADALFDSSRVPHRERWTLPLPTAGALLDDLAQGLEASLALLRDSAADDDALYFYRLVLFHEDMHHEAALYMAQHLDVPLAGWAPRAADDTRGGELVLDAGVHTLGSADYGFAFDNELGAHALELPAFRIDAAPVSWRAYLPFVEAGGYAQRAHWSDEGWAWREQQVLQAPRYLRAAGSGWQRLAFGRWTELDPALPAMNLSWHEAQAWCRWAGRRLPTEAEWELAATHGLRGWGQVWEWTADAFAPFPGFVPHPYRDYSAPWFHSRRVLRGGSFATHERMQHPRYRNFFPPERNDIFAGFRSCALAH
ncbi:MAG: ergothioneine biosynthesis protein EgtB [Ideonella sp.]|nr:ergothioneine biosynthesis protein EgtB [Ideonella sp.]MCC7458257.1 ergothioneine biosynthesis protein EgtB [Nitrospira sp.]